MVCQSWALQGYGTPSPIYIVYILKIALYVWLWSVFCSFTPGLGDLGSFSAWYYEPIAFQKAVLWSMAFEGLGLGCGSGPLTGRYRPPVGGALYFLRPGTTKVSLFPGIPVFGGSKRTVLDVLLYAAHIFFLFRALVAPELSTDLLLPTIVLLPLLGLTDKTIFLASRAEHYYTALVCFMFANDWLAGSKLGLGRDLDVGRDLEAQPSLSVGRRGDAEQQPAHPHRVDPEAVLPKLSGRPPPFPPDPPDGARGNRRGARLPGSAGPQ